MCSVKDTRKLGKHRKWSLERLLSLGTVDISGCVTVVGVFSSTPGLTALDASSTPPNRDNPKMSQTLPQGTKITLSPTKPLELHYSK